MQFSHTTEDSLGVSIITLHGELIDKNQANDMVSQMDQLIGAGKNKFVLDLGDLKYINSSGLNVLINLLTKARKVDGEVIICNVSKKVRELLVITKLNTVFTVTDNTEKAISKLK
jgi:anti-sigma B factor antagonist